VNGLGRKAFFEPLPRSAQEVRAFVRDACQAWHLPADAPVLMVDELATNAITHARTAFWVSARPQANGLRVEVGDGNPRLPALAEVGPEAESGRGLSIVAALARRWGAEPCQAGKTGWFEV
jgi:two-component sensor histidine kinase